MSSFFFWCVFVVVVLLSRFVGLRNVLRFRRRRLHRLEQEQAEIEYDIRLLMEQPESNKTDSDKAREDSLIARKIEVRMAGVSLLQLHCSNPITNVFRSCCSATR